MKIHFDPKDFLKAFKIAASVVNPKDKPILQNVKVVVDKKQGAVLHAVSLTPEMTGIRIRVDVDVAESGSVLLPAKQFIDILKNAQDERLVLQHSKEVLHQAVRLEIDGEYSECPEHYELDTESPDEFPDIAEFTAESFVEIDNDRLIEAIKHTVFINDTKANISAHTGVCLENDGDYCAVIATDGRRLAWQDTYAYCTNNHFFGWQTVNSENEKKWRYPIVPVKTLKLLTKALKEESIINSNYVKTAFGTHGDVPEKTHVTFHCGDVTIHSQLVAGYLSRWRDIVPKESRMHDAGQYKAGELLALIKSVTNSLGNYEPFIEFAFDGEVLTLTSGNGKEIKETTTTPVSTAGQMKIRFNPKYITDVLKALDKPTELSLYLPDTYDPAMFRNSDGYTYVVMPLADSVEADVIPEAAAERKRRQEEIERKYPTMEQERRQRESESNAKGATESATQTEPAPDATTDDTPSDTIRQQLFTFTE